MLCLIKACKTRVKSFFRLFGLDIRRIPQYEPYEWLKERNIQTVLDIGANTGQFARLINALLPNAIIYSFEPLVDCFNRILEIMSNVPRFRAFNFALGDRNGKALIYHNQFAPSSSLLPMEQLHKHAFPYSKEAKIEEIQIRRLDDVINELDILDNVLIKIDVQGSEDKVILGGEKLILKASILIVETTFQQLYKGQPLFDTIYDMLRLRGFVFAGSEDPLRDPRNGSILQCDSVFVREKQMNPINI